MEPGQTLTPKNWQDTAINCSYEFFGTALLSFSFYASATHAEMAFFILAIVVLSSPITGALINPSVILVVYLFFSKSLKENFFMFIVLTVSQFTGALFGCFLIWIPFQDFKINGQNISTGFLVNCIPPQSYQDANAYGQVFWMEIMCTSVLIFIILCQKNSQTKLSPENGTNCVSSILAIFALILFGGPVSACLMNPAFAMSTEIFYYLLVSFHEPNINHDAQIKFLWVYLVADYLGALLGFVLFKYVHYPLILGNLKTQKERTVSRIQDETSSQSFITKDDGDQRSIK